MIDAAAMSANSILRRYEELWGGETAYREMKITLAIEHFHSEDADFTVQEMYAIMTLLCMAGG